MLVQFGPCRDECGLISPAVLVVTDLFHPLDELSVELFLDCAVCHGGGWLSTMPMLFARREPDHVSGMDLFNGTALAPRPTATGRNDQGLTQRMSMPCGASPGFERDTGTGNACRSACLEQGINAHRAGKPIGRSFAGRL